MKKPAADPVAFKHLQASREQLSRQESMPYSEILRSVMDTKVFTCKAEDKALDIVRAIAERGISSVMVIDGQGRLNGILTDKDVVRRIVAAGRTDWGQLPIAEVMSKDPIFLHPENTIYRALSLLAKHGIKHLPLVENERLAGIVTMRQLLKLKYPEPMTLIEEINAADTSSQLAEVRGKLTGIAARQLAAGGRAHDIVTMLSLINQDIHARALELVIAELGPPPSPICLYVTGSHGRRENLLLPDQDHGLIIADQPEQPEIQYDRYFVELTSRLADRLHLVGFPLCSGQIMASNPLWRKSVSEWQTQIDYWFERQVRELGRFATVLFDAAPIWGDHALFGEVQEFAFRRLHQHHDVLRTMYEEAGKHTTPIGFLGRFITEKRGPHQGELNIKRSGLLFVVEGIRILALRHGIRETSTIRRAEKLVADGHIHQDDGEYFIAAYHILLHFALKTQLDKAGAGAEVDSFLNPRRLSARDKETLRHAYKAVTALQNLVSASFGELVL